jgi:hypothetical protein
MVTQTTLRVQVHYVAAGQPFRDNDASREETLASLKQRALTAFGLVEGGTPDGNQVTYVLYQGPDRLDDLSQTLGAIAGEHHNLNLKLVQQVIQGGR